MSRRRLPLTFRADAHPVSGESSFVEAGAFVLVFTSCIVDPGLQLRSTFTGGERRSQVMVAESAVLGSEPAELHSRLIEDGEGLLIVQRRRLLFDHLSRLQDLAIQRGFRLEIDGVDDAAELLDPAAFNGIDLSDLGEDGDQVGDDFLT